MKRLLLLVMLALLVAVAYYLETNYQCDSYKDKPITQAPVKCIEKYLKGMKP